MKLEMTVASLELVESTLVLPYDKAAYPTSANSTASAPGFRNRFAWLGRQLKMVPCPRVNNDISAMLFHKMLVHSHVVHPVRPIHEIIRIS